MSWETVIGLEVHVELSTATKIFCGCTTAFGGSPNTHCCPVCCGMPGTLPVLNRRVVEHAVSAGVALGCEITRNTVFDRKNYFYPDLPKAYQISQLYAPFARNGHLEIQTDGSRRVIRIHEIHMEEDAGKLIHEGDRSYIDYNRAGVPLLEIVSEPDFRESAEVLAYLTKLKGMFEYLGISDVKMQEGSLRVDVNLSVRKRGETALGVRTEMKNLGSFRSVERAIAYEAARQIAVLESHGEVVQETRRWDEDAGVSRSMRRKENANDYRYFPDPDLPHVLIGEELLAQTRAAMPEFAEEKAARYVREFALSEADARIIAGNKDMAELFEQTVPLCPHPKEIRYFLLGEALCHMGERGIPFSALHLRARPLAELVSALAEGGINRSAAKQVFEALIRSDGALDISEYITEHALAQVDDTGLIRDTVRAVLSDHPDTVAQYRAGKEKVAAFLIGQTMKRLAGNAKPDTVREAVYDELKR